MPVLHQYADKEGCYVLTGIKGTIVTFQLTRNGQERLLQSGIQFGQSFQRSLLLDLYRTGDAYTGGSGVKPTPPLSDSSQLTLDFPDDPAPENSFPACADCGSMDDLHLVEVLEGAHSASLLCRSCRERDLKQFDTSVPLAVVNLTALRRIVEMKGIPQIHPSVSSYQKLLETEFSIYWKIQEERKSRRQESLLLEPEGMLFPPQKEPKA